MIGLRPGRAWFHGELESRGRGELWGKLNEKPQREASAPGRENNQKLPPAPSGEPAEGRRQWEGGVHPALEENRRSSTGQG